MRLFYGEIFVCFCLSIAPYIIISVVFAVKAGKNYCQLKDTQLNIDKIKIKENIHGS